MKRIPYGISDFGELRRSNCYYVDKTRYIAMVEDDVHFVHFVRPRRFGKSLFLSMLEMYYDVEKKDKADEAFRGTWIADHPTPLKNSFLVLRMDFSHVPGDLEGLKERFDKYCVETLLCFADKYKAYFSEEQLGRIHNLTNAVDMLTSIASSARSNGLALYLILDEYDNFTNTVLSEHGQAVYRAITHASGFYRDFFKLFKGNFTRIFMTGVSPVTLNDLTSGFNISANISMESSYNAMLGLSESDVRDMIDYYRGEGAIRETADEILPVIRPWFDNYCFALKCYGREEGVYNTDMVMNFVRRYVREGHVPDSLVDPNVCTDTAKLRMLVNLDRLGGNREGDIMSIIGQGYIDAPLHADFPADSLAKPEIFPSLMFYYGMLTIGGRRMSKTRLSIPNETVRRQYYSFLTNLFSDAMEQNRVISLIDDMATTGDPRPFLDYALPGYARTCGVHSSIERERGLQSFLSAYMSLATYYNIRQEYELGGGYCDIIAYPSEPFQGQVDHAFIFELKSLRATDSQADADRQWADAEAQLRQYAADPAIPNLMAGARLHLIRFQAKDGKVVRFEEVAKE